MESRARRGYAYDDEESSENSEEELEDEGTNALQIALRDKEEALVQSALRRIRRAQEKGKREVKLNQDELDALEKRRKRMQASNAKAKKESRSSGGSGTEKKRRSDRNLITIPLTGEPSSRKKGKSRLEEPPNPPPGMLIEGPDGVTYAPVGYYPAQASTRNSPSRSRSASVQQLQAMGRPPSSYQTSQIPRHFSDGMRPTSSSSTSSRRPLPDDEDWIPGSSRRSSVSSQSFPIDPFEYQTSEQPPPIPQQYMQQGRRIVSGPADVSYSSLRRSPPSSYPAIPRSSGSDPALRLRDTYRDDLTATSEDDDDSDDLGNGVQVFVEERPPERERTVSRKPVTSGKKKGKR